MLSVKKKEINHDGCPCCPDRHQYLSKNGDVERVDVHCAWTLTVDKLATRKDDPKELNNQT